MKTLPRSLRWLTGFFVVLHGTTAVLYLVQGSYRGACMYGALAAIVPVAAYSVAGLLRPGWFEREGGVGE